MEDEILTIEEVAKYLRVSERTIYDWAQNTDMPCGKIGTVWRFKRSEIEKWVNSKLTPQDKTSHPDEIDFSKIISPERIIFTDSSTKHDCLLQLVEVLAKSPNVKDRAALEKAIFQREALLSTAFGHGIAIPHVRIESVTDLCLGLAISKKDIIDFNAFDERPVRLVFMVAAGSNQHAYYLKFLSELTLKLKDKKLAETLLACNTELEAYNAIIS